MEASVIIAMRIAQAPVYADESARKDLNGKERAEAMKCLGCATCTHLHMSARCIIACCIACLLACRNFLPHAAKLGAWLAKPGKAFRSHSVADYAHASVDSVR